MRADTMRCRKSLKRERGSHPHGTGGTCIADQHPHGTSTKICRTGVRRLVESRVIGRCVIFRIACCIVVYLLQFGVAQGQ